MDESPEGSLSDSFPNSINSVLCDSAFTKESVIQKIIERSAMPAVVLDFDLLYTGYAKSGMIAKAGGVKTYSPTRDEWESVLEEIILRVASEPTLVVVDSLNGFFSVFDGKDSGRYANACMMMMSSCASASGGKVFLCSVARLREGEGWILQPVGRRVLENALIAKFFASRKPEVSIEAISPENKTEKIFRM